MHTGRDLSLISPCCRHPSPAGNDGSTRLENRPRTSPMLRQRRSYVRRNTKSRRAPLRCHLHETPILTCREKPVGKQSCTVSNQLIGRISWIRSTKHGDV